MCIAAMAIVAAAAAMAVATTTAMSLAQSPPQSQSQPRTFSKADQLRMARELCGAAKRATAIDDIAGTPETLSGFLTADGAMFYVELLSETYEESRVARHVIAFGGHQMAEDGKIFTGQAGQTVVCAGVLESRGGAWSVKTQDAALTESGFNGRDPHISIEKIGAQRRVLRIDQTEWNAGSSMTHVTLFELDGDGFKELVSVSTDADDCGAGEPCFKWEGSLVPSTAQDELELRLKGSYRNDAGRIVKIPAAPLILRLTDGAYAPLSKTAATQALWKAVQSPW
jgi:hypothetical protein